MAANAAARQLSGGVDHNDRPVFDCYEPNMYAASQDRPLTSNELLEWKTFQLWRTTMAMERREDFMTKALSSDFSGGRCSAVTLGNPYPVVDPNPTTTKTLVGIRWYEHVISLLGASAHWHWTNSRPIFHKYKLTMASGLFLFNFAMSETFWAVRSMWRLQGSSENDAECRKYGIMETPEALREKAKRWGQYAAYRKEWMKRWDYNVWGIRPGERKSLWSACVFDPTPVMYNDTHFDYKVRRHRQLDAVQYSDEHKLGVVRHGMLAPMPEHLQDPADYPTTKNRLEERYTAVLDSVPPIPKFW